MSLARPALLSIGAKEKEVFDDGSKVWIKSSLEMSNPLTTLVLVKGVRSDRGNADDIPQDRL
jgi:hypothetical protein